MELIVQDFLQGVVVALLSLVSGLVVVWLNSLTKKIKMEISQEKYYIAMNIIKNLVVAAQQMGYIEKISDIGSEKFQYVLDEAEKLLNKTLKLDIDLDWIKTYIETAYVEKVLPFLEKPEPEPEPPVLPSMENRV